MTRKRRIGGEPIQSVDGNKYVLSEVGPKNKVLWKMDVGQVVSILVPVSFGGYKVESLIKEGRVHIRMTGHHMQNSKEVQMPIHRMAALQQDHSMHMHFLLGPLAARLAEEDEVFDRLGGSR